MSAREFLWVVKESALGTVMSSPTPGTDSIYIRLCDGNSFGMVARPVIEEIPYGGGFAVAGEAISDHYVCRGSLKTKLYPSQAQLLLDLLLTRVNSGQTAPWTTTELAGDLASVSIFHAVRRSDGSYSRKRFAGVKASAGTIAVSRQSTTASLALELQACRSYGNAMDGSTDPDSNAFPAPSESDYPVGPYTFKQTAGLLSIASTRTQYDSLSIQIQNSLDGRWFENPFLSINQFNGRSSTLETDLYFTALPDDRSAFEAITAQSCSVGFDDGASRLSISFNGKNYVSDLPYDLPLDRAFMSKLRLKNCWDPSAASGAGGDVSFAIASD
jgi:hypothetical protein